MRGRLTDISCSMSGRQRITIEIEGDFRPQWKMLNGQEINAEIKAYRKRRSMDANSYAWVLIGKLAAAIGTDKDSLYETLLRRYGVTESYTDDDGAEHAVIFTIAEGIPPGKVADHWARIGKVIGKNGVYIQYRAIKGTSEYDTKEMSDFLDGVISECREVGIETDTPEQIARFKDLWAK